MVVHHCVFARNAQQEDGMQMICLVSFDRQLYDALKKGHLYALDYERFACCLLHDASERLIRARE